MSIIRFLFTLIFLFHSIQVYAQSVEDLMGWVSDKDKKVNSIPKLLSRLPKSYRSEFTLMHRSKSLQDASPENPRVIMFGRDAKLIIAFNGDSSQKGYDKLEVIQFREKEAKFDFYEFEFPNNNNQSVLVSEPNPVRCLRCHTSDPRPNWEHYPNWPGAVLGEDDARNARGDELNFNSFIENIREKFPTHARYQYLHNLIGGYSVEPYGHPTTHNRDFNNRVMRLNYARAVRLLKTDPYYDAYKYLMLGSFHEGMVDCGYEGAIKNFFPPNFPPIKLHTDYFGQGDFRGIYEARQIEVNDFYTNFRSSDPQFTIVRSGFSLDFDYYIALGDSDLAPFVKFDTYKPDFVFEPLKIAMVTDCKGLASKSREALAKIPIPEVEIAERKKNRPAALEKCISCHKDPTNDIPQLPFDNRVRLKNHLSFSGYPRGTFLKEVLYRISEGASAQERMPPSGMSEDDRKKLIEYFNESFGSLGVE